MQWTVFCRVIDNWGDVGVCWRLCLELARRGQRVRLVIDDPQALAWMAPGGAPGAAGRVSVHAWTEDLAAGDVVVEAFGCALSPAFVQTMASQSTPAVWINLEYLSAEPYVERSHGLLSPQPQGLDKWFFYPGFTARTGGLLREANLLAQRAAFDGRAWLAAQGWPARAGERVVSLFCYANTALPALLAQLAQRPTLLLLTPGAAQQALQHLPQAALSQAFDAPALRCVALPWLSQEAFDHLLWACDINFVRGEDSLVRAIWAGAPWVWQAYPQHDGAHHAKVEALLETIGAGPELAAFWRAWNGAVTALPALPATPPWAHSTAAWRDRLAQQASLADALLAFVRSKRMSSTPLMASAANPPC